MSLDLTLVRLHGVRVWHPTKRARLFLMRPFFWANDHREECTCFGCVHRRVGGWR